MHRGLPKPVTPLQIEEKRGKIRLMIAAFSTQCLGTCVD